MILPTIAAITRDVMAVVPNHQREAMLAVGATRWEMIRKAVLPYAQAGIIGGLMLGLGRALGETMAALMVIGSIKDKISPSLFGGGITAASLVASELPNANDSLHESTLILIALVLFGITLVVNAPRAPAGLAGGARAGGEYTRMITQAPNYARRKWADRFMRGLTVGATMLALIPLFLILGYVVIRGAGALNLAFFTQAYEPPVVGAGGEVGNAGGVLHGIIGSLVIVGLALLMALPIGILAGDLPGRVSSEQRRDGGAFLHRCAQRRAIDHRRRRRICADRPAHAPVLRPWPAALR